MINDCCKIITKKNKKYCVLIKYKNINFSCFSWRERLFTTQWACRP